MGRAFRVAGVAKTFRVETRPDQPGDRDASAAALSVLLWVAGFDPGTAAQLRAVWEELPILGLQAAGRPFETIGDIENIQDIVLDAIRAGLITIAADVPDAPLPPVPVPPEPAPPTPLPPREVDDTSTYKVLVRDEHDQPLAGVRVVADALGFGRGIVTDGGGSAVFRNAPSHGLTARLTTGLPEALAPLLSRPPRDEDPTGGERVLLTPATQQRGFQIKPDVTTVVNVIARTDLSFDLPAGWETVEVDAPGPWQLSTNDHRGALRLLSDGTGRTVTLRCPRHQPAPFTGAFPASPLWTSDHRRVVQKGETLEQIAERYLEDALHVLFALNPTLRALGGGLASALHLPQDSIPEWLSIPKEVKSATQDSAAFDVFATIDVDGLHEALFVGNNEKAWAVLEGFPRDPRSDAPPLTGKQQLDIYTQAMNAEIESVANHDD